MTENIFTGIFTRFMKTIHVQLSNKTIDISMSKEFRKNLSLKLIDLSNSEFPSVSHPVNDGLVLLFLKDLKAFLDKICDSSLVLVRIHLLVFGNFYSLKIKTQLNNFCIYFCIKINLSLINSSSTKKSIEKLIIYDKKVILCGFRNLIIYSNRILLILIKNMNKDIYFKIVILVK